MRNNKHILCLIVASVNKRLLIHKRRQRLLNLRVIIPGRMALGVV